MFRRQFVTVAIAVASGFVGGAALTSTMWSRTGTEGVIRGTRFELVNDSGEVIALWGPINQNQVVLTFLGKGGNQLAGLGVDSNVSPFLTLAGSEGLPRASLRVGWREKPTLLMSDQDFGSRVKLGFIASDEPSPRDDTWGLVLGAPVERKALALIGYHRNLNDDGRSGSVVVRDGNGKTWKAP
jgi:hypothetical protein